MWKAATVATIVGLGLVATGLGASAAQKGGNLNFCTAGSDGCDRWKIENDAIVIVTGVTIHQKGTCEEKQMHHSSDLGEGDYFWAYVHKDCRYRVVYKTTKGCAGDKDRQENGDSDKKNFLLKYGCGDLQVGLKSLY